MRMILIMQSEFFASTKKEQKRAERAIIPKDLHDLSKKDVSLFYNYVALLSLYL